MTIDDLKQLLDKFPNVPKCQLEIADNIYTGGIEAVGSYIGDEHSGKHYMRIKRKSLNTVKDAISHLCHEAMHASLSDILNTLVTCGTLNQDTADKISERAAYTADGMVAVLVDELMKDKAQSTWR